MEQDRTRWPVGELRRHPQADIVPQMSPDEQDELRTDIAQRGITAPLDILHDGTIVDGRHRFNVALQEGFADVPVRVVSTDDPLGYMIRAALIRRHLTTSQRKALAEKLLKTKPEQSDRQVAKAVGLSHPTVAKVRDQGERTGDVEKVSTREDSKGRSQPVRKSEVALPSGQPKITSIEPKQLEKVVERVKAADERAGEAVKDQWEAAAGRLGTAANDLLAVTQHLVGVHPEYRMSVAVNLRKAARLLNKAAADLGPPKSRAKAPGLEIVIGERPTKRS